MNILQVITPHRIGGAETYFRGLVASLQEHGHDMTVVCRRDSELARLLEGEAADLRAWRTRGKGDALTLFRLCRLIRRRRIEVINTHLSTATWLASLAGRLTGVPVVAMAHATNHKFPYVFADRVIAVSQGVKEHLAAQGLPEEKIVVRHIGIDLERFAGRQDAAASRQALGLDVLGPVIGVVASLTPRKGHRVLLQAAPALLERFPGAHFAFAGEGPEEAGLRDLAASLGLREKVSFLGFQSDPVRLLSALDLFVLPSFKEGLPLAVMEALALEIPTVATDVAGTREVLHDGETGLLVPAGDAGALGKAILGLLGSPDRARQMAGAGRRLLEEEFDRERCLRAVEEVFLAAG